MTLDLFAQLFNRALRHSFHKKPYLFLFMLLATTSLLFLFFRCLAAGQEAWLGNSLLFIPLFLGMGVILAGQVLLSKLYVAEREGNSLSFRGLLLESGEQMLKVSYLTIPLLLLYLLLWLFSTLFLLLHAIPFVGPFLNAVLAFMPFLINLLSISLCLFTLVLSFFVCPQIALGAKLDRRLFVRHFLENPFLNLLFFLIPAAAVYLVYRLLFAAVGLTLGAVGEEAGIERMLQSFFIMLPFIAILTPIVNFFFNFAVEAATHKALQTE